LINLSPLQLSLGEYTQLPEVLHQDMKRKSEDKEGEGAGGELT
jgi:hypothetical protein